MGRSVVMFRKNHNKKSAEKPVQKSKDNAHRKSPPDQIDQGDQDMERKVQHVSDRMAVGICVVAIIGAGLLLMFFFSSDIKDKIILATSSKQATHQEAVTHPQAPADDQQADQKGNGEEGSGHDKSSNHSPGERDVNDGKDDVNISVKPSDIHKKDVVKYVNRMKKAEFKQFLMLITEHMSADDLKDSDAATDLYLLISEGKIKKKSHLTEYIKKMNDDDLDVFLAATLTSLPADDASRLVSGVATSPKGGKGVRTQERTSTSIEDAYEKAEALYPDKIDKSKRLKLIADLNATEYMYYVAEEGDTLIKLSRAFHVPLGQLVELNGIHNADKIKAGAIILFPSDTKQPKIK